VCIHTNDSRLISEFMALSHRIESLRSEVVAFIEQSRAIQEDAIAAALARSGSEVGLDPEGLALLATSAALSITREAAIGVDAGHGAIVALIERFLQQIEPAAGTAGKA